jgi:hypothetical protein
VHRYLLRYRHSPWLRLANARLTSSGAGKRPTTLFDPAAAESSVEPSRVTASFNPDGRSPLEPKVTNRWHTSLAALSWAAGGWVVDWQLLARGDGHL